MQQSGTFGGKDYRHHANGRWHTQPGQSQPQGLKNLVDRWIDTLHACPWQAHAGGASRVRAVPRPLERVPVYTAEERQRRDETRWTLVQGVLAPLQFLVFLVSLALVLRYLAIGEGLLVATVSVVLKTLVLYAIMVTGSIWEKVVFGKWLFARSFFWEDVVSMLVIALHTAYLAMLIFGYGSDTAQMYVALAAYAAYVVNAAQFLFKMQIARREHSVRTVAVGGVQ